LLVKLMVYVMEGIWVWISGSLFCFLLWQSHDCVFEGFSLLGPQQLTCVKMWHKCSFAYFVLIFFWVLAGSHKSGFQRLICQMLGFGDLGVFIFAP
jgi:hypothetical protein